MTRTRTYALLHVPGTVFEAMKALIKRAAGEVNIGRDGEIDMNGIALVKAPGTKAEHGIEIGTLLSASNGHGRIEMAIDGTLVQWDVADARKVNGMLTEAIEAAISDELIFKFLTSKVGLPAEKAAGLLVDFRELRQGSKETVNPS